jgi:hypothetical protein
MSFIFSRALAAASLPGSFSDADVFVPSSESHTPKQSSSPGKTMARSPLSRFGMTCEPLTADHGAALLTSWLEAFPARTSALPEAVMASTESEAVYGVKWRGSFAKYDPAESKWKTHQCSLLGGLDEFSETWPRWGSMRNGESFLRQTWTPPTFESESGSPVIYPTPCAVDTGSFFNQSASPNAAKRPTLGAMAKYALWPTPTASLADKGGRVTPSKSREGGTLIEALSARTMWPTPCASASKGSSPAALTRKSGRSRASDRIDHAVMASDGGQLNPEWVEWLMGWPIGHTALEPLETARLAEWQQQHGNF